MNINDKVNIYENNSSKGIRTRITAGYDLCKLPNGAHYIKNPIFEGENKVVIGGLNYILERINGIRSTSHNLIKWLSESPTNIGLTASSQGITIPNFEVDYPQDHGIFGYCIGIGGVSSSNDGIIEPYNTDYKLRNMIPFRYTNDEVDRTKYFGLKTEAIGGVSKTSYYVKKFHTTPFISNLTKTGVSGLDGNNLTEQIFNEGSSLTETFSQYTLRIEINDIKEYFNAIGDIEATKITEIGLVAGKYIDASNDYTLIKLITSLPIPTENLIYTKDLYMDYRFYME